MIEWSLKIDAPNKIWVGQIKNIDVLYITEQLQKDEHNRLLLGKKLFVLSLADPFSMNQYAFESMDAAKLSALSLIDQKMKLTYILLNAYQEKIERMMDGKES